MTLLTDFQMWRIDKIYPLDSHLPMRPETYEAILDAEYSLEETGGILPFIQDQMRSFSRADKAGIIFQ